MLFPIYLMSLDLNRTSNQVYSATVYGQEVASSKATGEIFDVLDSDEEADGVEADETQPAGLSDEGTYSPEADETQPAGLRREGTQGPEADDTQPASDQREWQAPELPARPPRATMESVASQRGLSKHAFGHLLRFGVPLIFLNILFGLHASAPVQSRDLDCVEF